MKEIWKNIKDFEHYQISNFGNIKNTYGRLLTPCCSKKGYMRIWLSNNKIKCKQFFIHRLVAEEFIPNPNNLP